MVEINHSESEMAVKWCPPSYGGRNTKKLRSNLARCEKAVGWYYSPCHENIKMSREGMRFCKGLMQIVKISNLDVLKV